MEINGKKVNGISIYNQNSKYNQGDIVLKDTTMYMADADVSGEDPETSSKFHIYLGDKFAGYSDFLGYIEEENPTEDKYISVKTLSAILNHYMTGINIKGVIQEVENEEGILDKIILDPEINFAVYTVDRSLSDIEGIYSGKLSIQQPDKLILKQYSYTYKYVGEGDEEEDRVMRVQELIDHSQYTVWYRKCDLYNKYSMSEWGNVSVNMTHLNERIKQLQKEYNDRMNAMRQVTIELRSNFRYRNIPVDNPSNKYIVPSEYVNNILTFGIKNTNGDITERCDISLDVNTSLSKFKSGDIYIKLESSDGGTKTLSLYSDSSYSNLHATAVIDNVILHENYE